MAPNPALAGPAVASARMIAVVPEKISKARRIVTTLFDFLSRRALNARFGYRLHSAPRILHWPLTRFWQFSIAASSAAAFCERLAPPQTLLSSAVAIAPHSRATVRKTTLHLSLPQIFSATSSAFAWLSSLELKPNLPLSSSRANAPYPASAGPAASADIKSAEKPTTIIVARRIETPSAVVPHESS